MKTIRVFIASSSELKTERMELVDLMQELNEEFEAKEIKTKPVIWEHMDSSMGIIRKEDEYIEKLRECEICFVLFWRTLGEYTEEELNVAIKEMRLGRLPRQVFVFFKETTCDKTMEKLDTFKESFKQNNPEIPVYSFKDSKGLRYQTERMINEYIKE